MRNLLGLLVLLPSLAVAQYPDAMGSEGELGRPGRRGMNDSIREEPIITVVQIRGPLPLADFEKTFVLSEEQRSQYAQLYDSFAIATKEPREAALRRIDQLSQAVGRDSAAVEYYRERLKELSKTLREAQSKFDDRMKKVLSRDQQKRYKDWRKKEDEAARQPARKPGIPKG